MGICSYLLIGHDRTLPGGAGGRRQGVHRDPLRRRRLHARHRAAGSECRQLPDRAVLYETVGLISPARLTVIGFLLLLGARSARAHSSRCTPGCRTRWPARRRSPHSSTPPPWSPPASSCWPGCSSVFRSSTAVMITIAVIAVITMLLAALRRDRAGRHQAGAGLEHGQPGGVHVRRVRRRIPRHRAVPPAHPRRFQGAAVPRGRLRDPRGRHQLDDPDGRPAPDHAGHLHHA